MDRKGNVINVPQFSRDTVCKVDEIIRGRLLNVLDYIAEVEKIGAKIPLSVADHRRPAFYEHQLNSLPGVRYELAQGSQMWLEVKRLQPTNPPLPDNEILRSFVKVPNDPAKMPFFNEDALRSAVEDEMVEEIDEAVADRLRIAWQDFLEGPHGKWCEKEIPRRQTINIYATLFGLKRAMEVDSASDPIELVWGIGLALWKTQGQIIEYPLLLQGVEIHIDDRNLNIYVSPRESETIIELSPFSALNNEGTTPARRSMTDFLEGLNRPLSPFDSESFTGALRACISILDSTGHFWEKDKQDPPTANPPAVTGRLVITDSWVLFVRPKTIHFLLQDLERLKEAAKSIENLPAGPYALFKDPSKEPISFSRIPFRGISSPNPEPMAGRSPEDLFFPKPYNREQVQIVERLEQAPGVVAQGPPGTGKTHTIANIICHNLAKGRSILVTSKGEQALRVLKNKLPAAIQPLCVSLLASDREALKEMEQAVDSILQRLQSIDKESLRKDIEADRKQVDYLCASVARSQNEINDWARKQLKEVKYQGRHLMPNELAQLLVRDSEIHSWLPAPVTWTVEPFSINDDEILLLRKLRRKIGKNLVKLGWSLPELDQLPTVDEYADLHQALTRKRKLIEAAEIDGLPVPKRDYTKKGLKRANQLLKAFRLFQKVVGYENNDRQRWCFNLWQVAKKRIDGQEYSAIADQIRYLFNEIIELENTRNELIGNPVNLPEEASEDAHFVAAVDRLADGLSPFGPLGGLTKGRQKNWLKEVRLLGVEPSDQHRWSLVKRHIAYAKTLNLICSRWNAFMRELNGPIFETIDLEAGKLMAIEARNGREVFFCLEKGLPFITQVLPHVFTGPEGHPADLEAPDTIVKYAAALQNHLNQGWLITAENKTNALKKVMANHANELCRNLLNELNHNLGNPNIDHNTLLEEWGQLREEVAFLYTLQPLFAQTRKLAAKIEQAGALYWAKALLREPASEQTDLLLPLNWQQGVEWHRFMNYLEGIDGQYRLHELADELRKAEKRLSQTQERLVENVTWLRMTKISEEFQRALRQYAIAVGHIGAGTGKVRTPRYRREAREAMKKAVGAVPCWIMPHWRISETLPADIGRFDLVIIDEASQSDIWALPALLRGSKILVVGDDKQVSPTVIGKSEATLNILSQQYLKGFDLGKQMGPESSIYDLAQVAFAADNICLREHFRCAEPIIIFSDRQWYRCLVPLRVPKPNERIDPPLVDVYVKDGNRGDRNKINKPEANAIVREIKNLTQDSAFNGRSIGVISLLGQGAQAKYIAQLLFHAIGEEKIREHDIVCGDPSSFQGNEKDIILLSMVDDRNHLRARVDKASAQRFNVAASRARDRMYLFRSFRREDVLNPNDLRGALLDHFRNPLTQDSQHINSLRELCESDFEERIYDALVEKGYRVTPQVSAGGFRIDLVVEGTENRRLAIECDGARYHGPERYFEDLSRQRVLERAGWTFWRCWGSTFYREPEGVLVSLFEKLEEMGITPIGASTEVLTGYTEYREVCGLEYPEDNNLKAETDGALAGKECLESTESDLQFKPDKISIDSKIEPQRAQQSNRGLYAVPTRKAASVNEGNISPIATIASLSEVDIPKKVSTGTSKKCVCSEDSVTYCFIGNEDEIKTVQIVKGPNKPSMGIINVNAPLAKSLLGSQIGDEVEVRLPTGIKTARVLNIERVE